MKGLYSDAPDMPLLDQDASMMNTLRQAELVDASLEAALQEVLNLQSKHVIELHAGFIEHTDTDKTANEGVAFEEALGVFLIEGKKLTVIAMSVNPFASNSGP